MYSILWGHKRGSQHSAWGLRVGFTKLDLLWANRSWTDEEGQKVAQEERKACAITWRYERAWHIQITPSNFVPIYINVGKTDTKTRERDSLGPDHKKLRRVNFRMKPRGQEWDKATLKDILVVP